MQRDTLKVPHLNSVSHSGRATLTGIVERSSCVRPRAVCGEEGKGGDRKRVDTAAQSGLHLQLASQELLAHTEKMYQPVTCVEIQ